MNQIIKLVIAALFVSVTSLSFADTAKPDPHKKPVESTKQGDYLKDQPGDTSGSASDAAGATNNDGKSSLEKSKSHKEKPDAGGVDVKNK
ncbi:MAG TPA: hypothetical protein VK974_03815 [Methylophilaceae bacterium]|nr:hypothetical protein [Methylophilaceae bacterium]